MKSFILVLVLCVVVFGQQQNTPGASLTLIPTPPPIPGQTWPINVTSLEISGTPGQPYWLYVGDGAPWYGALQLPQGSVDIAFWNGLVLLVEGTLPAAIPGESVGTIVMTSGPIISLDVTLQAAVWDPLASNGFTLTQAIHLSF